MIPTVYLIRHGKTDLNDPGDERIRAWSDIPINAEGREMAELAGKELKGAGIYKILSSDLQRTMLTSQIVAEQLGSAQVVPDRGLRPWDLGKFQGEPISKVAKQLDKYQEFPDMKVPDGESYRTFYSRWSECLERMIKWAKAHPDKPIAGVTHSRNLLSLPTILGRKHIGDVPVKGGPPPGCVTKITCLGDDEYQIEHLPCHA